MSTVVASPTAGPVRHVGEVFKDKSAGTTLRLVCDENDALMMATHALNVGRHRRKL
jgi:hypothetical protein